LYTKNKRLKKLVDSEEKRFSMYKIGIERLKNSNFENPEKDFELLNQYVRAFFKEYLQLDFSLTYLELEDMFKKQKKYEYADLCKMMSDVDYKGEKTKKEEIQKLVNIFHKILNEAT